MPFKQGRRYGAWFDDPALPDNRPVIRVENPRAAFAALLELFRHRAEVERVVSDKAYIAPSAKIGKDVAVMPFAYIDEGAEIGDGTVIYPHVYVGRNVKVGSNCLFYPSSTIREGCVLGNKVVLQSGAVIGGDGFGYITDKRPANTALFCRQAMLCWRTRLKSAAIPVLIGLPQAARL